MGFIRWTNRGLVRLIYRRRKCGRLCLRIMSKEYNKSNWCDQKRGHNDFSLESRGVVLCDPHSILREHGTLYSPSTRALIIHDESESVDIDTPLDWALAEAILTNRED